MVYNWTREARPRKTLGTWRKLTIKSTHIWCRDGIEPRPHFKEASALTSAKSLHPNTTICLDKSRVSRTKKRNWLIFFSCIFSVLGLICYQCTATVSWERCRTTTKTCHPNSDRCAKAHYKYGDVVHFNKNCIPKRQCTKETYYFCKRADECDVTCCDSDDCNAGSLFLVSGILFLTCAVISLVSLNKTWNWSDCQDWNNATLRFRAFTT